MSLVLIWLVACEEPVVEAPVWTREQALQGTLVHMDRNGDGRVVEQEYGRLSYGAPGFAVVDADGDGTIGISELEALVTSVEPLDFDGLHPRRTPTPRDAIHYFPSPFSVRVVRDALRFLAAEVRAVDPDHDLPDDATIGEAAQSASLTSPPTLAVLERLRVAHEAVGLSFPEGLSSAPEPLEDAAAPDEASVP